jgi:regulator of protease activity HflC (stomatin/prohibitin superfamily)
LHRLQRTTLAVLALVVAALALSGCSNVSTGSDQTALHYKAGPFSSTKFANCVPASQRNIDGPADKHFTYPTSQRTYDATGGDAAEANPFVVVSKDNAEMRVPVTITFTLDDECETLRAFHERLGNRYAAYDGGDGGDGWAKLLNFVIGKPLDTALDRVAQGYNWRDLWNNPATKTELEKAVDDTLSDLVERQAGGDFFDIGEVLIQKPEPVNKELKDAVATEQSAVASANSAKAKADADRIAAEAQIAVAKARGAALAAEKAALGEDWIKKYAIDNKITPWPAPVVAGQAAPR